MTFCIDDKNWHGISDKKASSCSLPSTHTHGRSGEHTSMGRPLTSACMQVTQAHTLFPLFSLGHGPVFLPCTVPTSVNLREMISYWCPHRCATRMILNPIKLPIKISHHETLVLLVQWFGSRLPASIIQMNAGNETLRFLTPATGFWWGWSNQSLGWLFFQEVPRRF